MSTHNVWRYWDDYRKEKPSEPFDAYVARVAQQEADARRQVTDESKRDDK